MPLIQLCWFMFAHVFLKVVKFCEILGVLYILFSCVCNLFLFIVVSMCVGFKSQDRRSSTHIINSFR
jgi:hypothetical protein